MGGAKVQKRAGQAKKVGTESQSPVGGVNGGEGGLRY